MTHSERLVSLDALRGLTILSMIIVNNPADWSTVFKPLLHADWAGCSPTDLIFPFFLYITGFSLYISIRRRTQKGASKNSLFRHLLVRSLVIFGIGLFLNAFPFTNLDNLRILGVLQRIALVNLAVGTLMIYSSQKSRWFIGALFLMSYWILLQYIPSPIASVPSLAYEDNWVAWLDQAVLGSHTWDYMPLMDPEGILSTLPAIVTGLIGLEIASFFTKIHDKKEKIILLFITGFIMTIAGIAWSSVFPMIKKLWTSSYVLYTVGLATWTLGFFYWLADFREKKKYLRLLVAYGSNPLAIYAGSGLLVMILGLIPVFGNPPVTLNSWIYRLLCESGIEARIASLVWPIILVLVWGWIALILHKKKIFIKI